MKSRAMYYIKVANYYALLPDNRDRMLSNFSSTSNKSLCKIPTRLGS